jgi:glycosyltransferase involved in cell wall biosynthesis
MISRKPPTPPLANGRQVRPARQRRGRDFRRLYIPRFADAANLNAQAKNVQNILRRWRSSDWRPLVLAAGPPDPLVAANPNVSLLRITSRGHPFPSVRRLFSTWFLAQLYLAFFRRADAVFYPGGHHWIDWLALRTRSLPGLRVPVIATFEGLAGSLRDDSRDVFYSRAAGHQVCTQRLPPRVLQRLDDIYRMSTHIIAISPFLGRMAASRYGDKVSVLPLGVDISLFRRSDFGGRERSRVICAGNVSAHKRPQVFLRLGREFPNADFVWFGDGDLRQSMLREIASQGLSNIRFPGAVPPPELGREFVASDIFAFPSMAEGVPKVTQEAAAAGLPQVIFGFYEAPSVVDGRNGFVVWNDDELCERVGQLLSDPDLVARMGRAGQLMAQHWSWDILAPQWEEKIIALVEGHRRAEAPPDAARVHASG